MTGYRVELISATPSPCAVVREPTTWESFEWKPLLDQVWTYLRARPEIAPGHNVMIYHRLPESDAYDVQVEIGVEVPAPIEPAGRVISSTLPAGRAASVVHHDSPATLDAAYQALADWCEENGEVRAATHWEVYGDPDPAGSYPIRISWLLD
ncbi:MAG TPA: GyrI-like domain-containing protein [Microlunatus sp.]